MLEGVGTRSAERPSGRADPGVLESVSASPRRMGGISNRAESATNIEMVGAAATASRGSTTALGAAASGGSSGGGTELTNDAPPSKPKRRGRPPKALLSAKDSKAKAIEAKKMAARSAAAALKEEAAAVAAPEAGEAPPPSAETSAATAAASTATATELETVAVNEAGDGSDDDNARAAQREAVEASIREDGAPTVVTSAGFAPMEDEPDHDDEDSIHGEEENHDYPELPGTDAEQETVTDEEEREGEEGRGKGGRTKVTAVGGEASKGISKGKGKGGGKGGGDNGGLGRASAADMDKEEARQDKQAEAIQVSVVP